MEGQFGKLIKNNMGWPMCLFEKIRNSLQKHRNVFLQTNTLL